MFQILKIKRKRFLSKNNRVSLEQGNTVSGALGKIVQKHANFKRKAGLCCSGINRKPYFSL